MMKLRICFAEAFAHRRPKIMCCCQPVPMDVGVADIKLVVEKTVVAVVVEVEMRAYLLQTVAGLLQLNATADVGVERNTATMCVVED